MKQINIYPILSPLHDDNYIKEERAKLLNDLNKNTGYIFSLSSIENLYNTDLSIILVESGGSENYFLQVFDRLKPPFIFLTFKHNNSLAASLEILAFLTKNNIKGEILHGDNETISNRIKQLVEGESHE